MVQREPFRRIERGFSNAVSVRDRVRRVVERIEAGGRVLDLEKPMPCLFCEQGFYRHYSDGMRNWPKIQDRLDQASNSASPLFQSIRDAAENFGLRGGAGTPVPLILVCEYCGNVQLFRLDLSRTALTTWKP